MDPIACCFLSTTTLFVDDHANFLEGLRFALIERNPCLFYDRPLLALEFLNAQNFLNDSTKHCIKPERDEEPRAQASVFHFDLASFAEEIYNPTGFVKLPRPLLIFLCQASMVSIFFVR